MILTVLQEMLNRAGSSLDNFGLPAPCPTDLPESNNLEEEERVSSLIAEEMSYTIEGVAESIKSMNEEQKHVYNCVMDAVEKNACHNHKESNQNASNIVGNSHDGRLFFIDAPGRRHREKHSLSTPFFRLFEHLATLL